MSCVAIIPARGGSTRIPGKNKRLFHGKPIIAYSIETAKESGLFDQVLVTTDDIEIARIAMSYGAEAMPRSEEMAKDETGTQEVMRDSLQYIDCEYACCLYATAPMLDPETLREAFLMLRDSTYVVPMATWMKDPGQFYFGHALAFLKDVPLICNGLSIIPISPETECDINTPEDWTRAEQMYTALQEKK